MNYLTIRNGMLWGIVFLGLFTISLSAQIAPPLTQEFVDWLPVAIRYQKILSTGTTEEKREALFQIRNLRSAEASRLALPALKDSNEIVRATAAGSVIFLPAGEAATALLPLLTDKTEMVRREAAYALGEAGDPSAVTALTTLLRRDKIIEVKGAAAVALGKIGDAGAVGPLDRILQDKPDEDHEFLRRSAARSIGQIAQFIQTGKISKLTPQNFLSERFKELDKPKYPNLAANFPAFGPAVKTLITALQNKNESDDTRREAAFALGAIGDAAALPALQTGLNSPDPYLAEICKEALAKIRQLPG
jgi:HEAT repeat protein